MSPGRIPSASDSSAGGFGVGLEKMLTTCRASTFSSNPETPASSTASRAQSAMKSTADFGRVGSSGLIVICETPTSIG
jgi:hypothetical protein